MHSRDDFFKVIYSQMCILHMYNIGNEQPASSLEKMISKEGYLCSSVLGLRFLQSLVPLRAQLSASVPGLKTFFLNLERTLHRKKEKETNYEE
jgi:hypothetical protein